MELPALIERPPASLRTVRRARARGRVGFARADRATAGLAALALATAGSVLVGEVARLARRRVARRSRGEQLAGPEQALALAVGRATQDAIVVARAGYGAAGRGETVLFNLLSGFVGAFALVRLSTTGIRRGWWPLGDVVVRGRHIHHFVPGILLAFGAGTASLLTGDEALERRLAVPFGIGVGLTLDEAALLLDLRDVYWTREGVLSVQLSLALAAIIGGSILALRMLARGESRAHDAGKIPDPMGGWHDEVATSAAGAASAPA